MEIKKKTVLSGFDEYEIKGDDGEDIFLTIRSNSYPLSIWSGSARGEKIRNFKHQVKAVKTASEWLLKKLNEERSGS